MIRDAYSPDELAVEDILEAMREQGSYLDISPDDALALYRLAYAHAAARLERDAPVDEIMTRAVVSAAPGDGVLDVARAMAAGGVSGLPVVDGGTVVGVLSVKDILRLLGLPAQATTAELVARCLDPSASVEPGFPQAWATPVSSLMTSPAVTIGPGTLRSQAARLMAERGLNRLPVVDATGLRGIVSRGDIARSCHWASKGERP